MNEPTAKRDEYRSTRIVDLRYLQDHLFVMCDNDEFTEETRRLAADEADYLEDVIAFRLLSKMARKKLCRVKSVPWLGTWKRDGSNLTIDVQIEDES